MLLYFHPFLLVTPHLSTSNILFLKTYQRATSSINVLLPQPSSTLTALTTTTNPTIIDNTSLTLGVYIGLPLAVLTIILLVVSTVLIIVIIRYRKQCNG